MAIKMDGHTITALQLKASDGSEVTKQLTEEGTIPTPTEALSITANGTYDVTDKASAIVNVPAPEINLQTKTATANGDVVADAGYDGLEKVIVNVSGDVPTLITKSITANGTYNASADNADGYSSVTVNVPAPVLPTLTNPASAADILSGKEAIDSNGAKLTGTCSFDADTSDADATAADIAKDKTAYVNGSKIIGTASVGGIVGTEIVIDEAIENIGQLVEKAIPNYSEIEVSDIYIIMWNGYYIDTPITDQIAFVYVTGQVGGSLGDAVRYRDNAWARSGGINVSYNGTASVGDVYTVYKLN